MEEDNFDKEIHKGISMMSSETISVKAIKGNHSKRHRA